MKKTTGTTGYGKMREKKERTAKVEKSEEERGEKRKREEEKEENNTGRGCVSVEAFEISCRG